MSMESHPSIRRRTLAILLGTAGLGILATGLILFGFQYRSARQVARQDLQSLGVVLAYNAAPMLSFDDPENAARLLEALRQRPDIKHARILRGNGSELARYPSQAAGSPAVEPSSEAGGLLLTSVPIQNAAGYGVGTLLMESDQVAVKQQIRWTATALFITLVILGGGVFLLSLRLQHYLTDPVLDLAGLAEVISKRKDFSLRARPQRTRELDILASALNEMLARIQSQDRELEANLQQLAQELQERKQAEAALRASEQRYRGLVENTSDMMFWVCMDRRGDFFVEDLNPAQERILGMARSQVVGRRIVDILPPDVAAGIVGRYRQCLDSGAPLSYEERAELPTGLVIAQTLLVPLVGEDGEIRQIIGTSRDITQHRSTEEAFRQAQKLESLGVLAGGIAHDFNDLLAAILGNLNLAQSLVGPGGEALPFLDKVEKTVLRASDLTQQMLAYSGRGRFEVKPLDLNHTVTEIGHLLAVSIAKTLALSYQLEQDIPSIAADAAQIQQVVMNLVTNASDAIGDRPGSIVIRTSTVGLDHASLERDFATQGMRPGQYVLLEVRDTGSGISEEVLARIFDPFFTTKPKGRGLGLSAMLGILRGHKGGIRIQSRMGEGSTFHLYFPSSELLVPAAAPVPVPEESPLACRVLLVDDEEEVREASAMGLQMQGLVVVEARNGLEALNLFRDSPQDFHLVVMDLTMPHMDGRTAFREIRKLDPQVPVILISGFDEGELPEDFDGQRPNAFIQKPYRLSELRRKVAEVMKSS